MDLSPGPSNTEPSKPSPTLSSTMWVSADRISAGRLPDEECLPHLAKTDEFQSHPDESTGTSSFSLWSSSADLPCSAGPLDESPARWGAFHVPASCKIGLSPTLVGRTASATDQVVNKPSGGGLLRWCTRRPRRPTAPGRPCAGGLRQRRRACPAGACRRWCCRSGRYSP
jgi:hypothetical protein